MRRRPGLRRWLGLFMLSGLLAVAGCGSGGGPTADPDTTGPVVRSGAGALPRPAHVVVVIFENKDQAKLFDRAPYLARLAGTGADFVRSHGIAHPSQPNYIALLSGSTHGVRDDSCPHALGGKPNLARQLIDAGYTFAGYSESMPTTGFTGCSAAGGLYQRKHNPWADFSNVPASGNRPYTRFPADLSRLPTVSFVVPNMCDDMHSCPISAGDRWAHRNLPRYVSWARSHNSLLVVTFDEDDNTAANHIPTFLVGPMVRPGRVPQRVDHYNVLRTLEDMYGLSPLGLASRAHPLRGWTR